MTLNGQSVLAIYCQYYRHKSKLEGSSPIVPGRYFNYALSAVIKELISTFSTKFTIIKIQKEIVFACSFSENLVDNTEMMKSKKCKKIFNR